MDVYVYIHRRVYAVFEQLKNSSRTVGLKQSTKAVEQGIVKTAFVAKDAEEKVVRGFKELCTKKSVEIIYVDTMKELGKYCGIDVEAAVACLLK